ncbi:hypothetical protein HW555_007113 [Spodoptera exigua]|uniref:Uncharacterized protein n=1 Tax=Spodoptera exigua TaxID=7107 RepID=A0A835L9C1_SPOEX|nr:hypothetical protein HW555_007113 [Spodoptera exigua]
MLVLILFLIPIIVKGRIEVDIIVKSNGTDVTVNASYTGSDHKLVTDEDLKLFNVTMAELNRGMRVELGKVPDAIFIRNPTPYGDLFTKFKWEQMKRKLTVVKTKIIDIVNQDIVLDTHEHINNTTNIVTAKRSMFKVMDNSISSTWSKTGLPGDNAHTTFILNFEDGKAEIVKQWRNESTMNFKIPVGITEKGLITIAPEQTAVTKLIVSRTIILIEIIYKAELSGSLIGNYAELYGKYHYWAPAVKKILKAAKVKNEIFTREVVELRCFTRPRLAVYDKKTGGEVETRRKRPRMKIIRNNNQTRIIYIKTKHHKKNKKNLQ